MRSALAMATPAPEADSFDEAATSSSRRPQRDIAHRDDARDDDRVVIVDDVTPCYSSGDLTLEDRDMRLLEALLGVLEARRSDRLIKEITTAVSNELEWD